MPINMPRAAHRPTEDVETASESIVLGHAVRTIPRYRYPIMIALLGAMILYGIAAAFVYLSAPSQPITSLPFRLEFAGAERGQYPNGTKFSSAEIIETPILSQVYAANSLDRFVSFRDFSSAIFVIESNSALEQLAREYQPKLADPKLSSVDRERLEKEFELKRESLSRSEYSLNFAANKRTSRLPHSLVLKSLSDILNEWARSAAEEKGVLRHRIPVLTKNILDRGILGSGDYLIALDILRTRIDNVTRNIDALLRVPGSEVLRVGPDGVSLTETRLLLGDTIRFKIQPLLSRIRAGGRVADARATLRYMESQLEYNELQAKAAESNVAALREALNLYAQRESRVSPERPAQATQAPQQSESNVTPQLSESFLDRLVQLTGQSSDMEYRQDLVDRITAASIAVIPFRQESEYYRDALDQLRSLGTGPTSVEDAAVRTQLQDILNDISRGIDNLNTIYNLISKNLHASSTLYTVISPPVMRKDRAVSLPRLALYGVLVFLIALPVAIAGALLHNRIREEEQLEDLLVTEARHATERSVAEPEYSKDLVERR